MDQRRNIRRGMAVMSSDGVQMGRVIDVLTDAIIIEKGQFFLRDFRIPIDDISQVRGDEIVLMRDQSSLRKADSGAAQDQGMDSAKFQNHSQYDLRPSGGSVPVLKEERRSRTAPPLPPPPFAPAHEPPMVERRAAGPGWDPLSVDEEQKEAPRTSGPDPKAPTRY